MNKEIKEYIDSLTYAKMLTLWRFGESNLTYKGVYLFRDEVGVYFAKRMQDIEPENVAEISKMVGWKK